MSNEYKCWLQYKAVSNVQLSTRYKRYFNKIISYTDTEVMNSALKEIKYSVSEMLEKEVVIKKAITEGSNITPAILLSTSETIRKEDFETGNLQLHDLGEEGYLIKTIKYNANESGILIQGNKDIGVLYGVHHLLRLIQKNKNIDELDVFEQPKNELRMINQWDNIDGTIERGYAGKSIFYTDNKINVDSSRVVDYARLLSSIGINAISINNVNVWDIETKLITKEYLSDVKKIEEVFSSYGIKMFLSVNYASPITIGNLSTADPLSVEVQQWWRDKVSEIYQIIPDFGGFVVKADSEGRPGPFSYNRDHAEGANLLARALKAYNGLLIWRCFVYNHVQDWRDRNTDRARAAYDNFMPLDGQFEDNVILQIKNGPMDFQVREPISPLIGAMKKTNQMLELQITQEYTGQQIDICYLIPQWKEVLDFDTYSNGKGSLVKRIVDGSIHENLHAGIAAVSNIGLDNNWTGNFLAQANLFGYGKLTWNPDFTVDEITDEWLCLTIGENKKTKEIIKKILLNSWNVYEKYNAPLGVGWMVNPNHHYGPNVDGYEYSAWGTYHFADRDGIGVDRTQEAGTGYTSQYYEPNSSEYESLDSCPDELLLFFHHVPYSYKLKSGKTVIQHIYDTHFEGVELVEGFIKQWSQLKGGIDKKIYDNVNERLKQQYENATNWRDQVNTYFYRKSGIQDEGNRNIYS